MGKSGIKWRATPKHIMRKECLKHILKGLRPGEFVEFGAGTGDFTALFLDMGYKGTCYDLGEESRNTLRENLKNYGDRLTVVDSLDEIGNKKFDYLLSFEVLEHIEDDLSLLKEWTSFLKSGGYLIVSVPAHKKKFTKDDEFHGHVRRYEKKELNNLMENVGYKNIRILNYGFPLGNMTRLVNTIMFSFISEKDKDTMELSTEERSIRSGIERFDKSVKLSFLFNRFFMFPFLILQKLFFTSDLSDGYVAIAEKK